MPPDGGQTVNDLRRHIPNLFSLSRLVMAAAFPFVDATGRIWLCVLAALSDVADGFVARQLDIETAFGNIIDPAADKTFVLVAFLTFLFEDALQVWEVVAILARDIAVVGSVLVLLVMRRPKVVGESTSRIAGKATTVLQFTVFLTLLIWEQSFLGLVIGAAAVSTIAGVDYIWDYYRTARKLRKEREQKEEKEAA